MNFADILITMAGKRPRPVINFRDWETRLSRKSAGIVEKFSEFYILKTVKVNWFIFGKIHKNIATRAALFGSNMHTKSFVGWGLAPNHTGGAYSDPQTP